MGSESKRLEAVGISEKLKEIAKLSLDRLPVLNGIFENLALACVERFRDYCAPVFSAFVNQLVSGDSWDLLEGCADSVSVIFYCREWDARIVIGLERRCIFAILEAMYGGEGSELPFEATRPFTSLESKVGRLVGEFAAEALQKAFIPVAEITLVVERVETTLEFTSLGQNSMMMIQAKILFQVLDQGGIMFVLIPQNAMNPIRQKLEREHRPLPPSHDPRWTNALSSRVSKAEVVLHAVMDGKNLELDELLKLGPGKTLSLTGTDQSVVVECESDRLFRGRLGQARGVFTITIEEPINDEVYSDDGPPSESGGK